ncbi:TPA: hypothetical protein VL584_001661 [Streptococcus pyogenes]|nr:hypothetical protein [Streptococcus pyogenes]
MMVMSKETYLDNVRNDLVEGYELAGADVTDEDVIDEITTIMNIVEHNTENEMFESQKQEDVRINKQDLRDLDEICSVLGGIADELNMHTNTYDNSMQRFERHADMFDRNVEKSTRILTRN